MNYLEDINVPTPLGEFHMIVHTQHGRSVVQASGFGDVLVLQKRLPVSLAHMELRKIATDHLYALKVCDYFKGNLTALDEILYKQTESPFYQKVWRAISDIMPGQTCSYKELAALAGNTAAVRAAGTACSKNLLILIIPCHRVIKTDGGLGNYVYGLEIKKKHYWRMKQEVSRKLSLDMLKLCLHWGVAKW